MQFALADSGLVLNVYDVWCVACAVNHNFIPVHDNLCTNVIGGSVQVAVLLNLHAIRVPSDKMRILGPQSGFATYFSKLFFKLLLFGEMKNKE